MFNSTYMSQLTPTDMQLQTNSNKHDVSDALLNSDLIKDLVDFAFTLAALSVLIVVIDVHE